MMEYDKNIEKQLVQAMNKGFERAAESFCALINRPVKILNNQPLLISTEEGLTSILKEEGDLHILVTEIIGEFSGKSFLIFNQEESNEIFNVLNSSMTQESFQHAFLLEIDNIISASVIAELSNTFDVNIYGDVPQLHIVHAHELERFITQHTSLSAPSSYIICNTLFLFDNKEEVHPQFIWKICDRIFELIAKEDTNNNQL